MANQIPSEAVMSKELKKRNQLKGASRPAAVPARRREGWKSSKSGQRINWWDADQTPTQDWRVLGLVFLFTFGCFMAMLLMVVLTFILVDGITPLFTRKGNVFGDGLEILWGILTFAVLVSAYVARGVTKSSLVFRFEIDLKAEQIVLHETYFPNRKRVVFVPFCAIGHVRLRRFASYGGVELELNYGNDDGQYVNVGLGKDIDEDALGPHVELMRPALGGRVLEMLRHDS